MALFKQQIIKIAAERLDNAPIPLGGFSAIDAQISNNKLNFSATIPLSFQYETFLSSLTGMFEATPDIPAIEAAFDSSWPPALANLADCILKCAAEELQNRTEFLVGGFDSVVISIQGANLVCNATLPISFGPAGEANAELSVQIG